MCVCVGGGGGVEPGGGGGVELWEVAFQNVVCRTFYPA